VKLSTITRERATFKDFHGEGTIAFQHKLKYNGKKNKLKFSTIHIEGKKVVTFQPHVYVPSKVDGPTNKCLPNGELPST
jgi:hypothetical protein